jgi:integrase
MFLDGSAHMGRRIQLGRQTDRCTQIQARIYIKYIIEKWGKMTLAEINPADITKYLFTVSRSSSWKNRYTSIFGEIYSESQWYGCRVERPRFQQFARIAHKADILTTAELERLFVPGNFPAHEFYLFFLLCLSGGLRLGEVRAARPKQFLFEQKALIVDGFCKYTGARTNYNKTGSPVNPRFRIVLLPDITLEKMKAHIAETGAAPDDFCFDFCLKEGGHPVRQSRAESVFSAALAKAGIDAGVPANQSGSALPAQYGADTDAVSRKRKLVVHSLRYTYVTRMRRELPASVVMRMAGHINEGQTDYYTDRRAIDETLAAIAGAGQAANNLFS